MIKVIEAKTGYVYTNTSKVKAIRGIVFYSHYCSVVVVDLDEDKHEISRRSLTMPASGTHNCELEAFPLYDAERVEVEQKPILSWHSVEERPEESGEYLVFLFDAYQLHQFNKEKDTWGYGEFDVAPFIKAWARQ